VHGYNSIDKGWFFFVFLKFELQEKLYKKKKKKGINVYKIMSHCKNLKESKNLKLMFLFLKWLIIWNYLWVNFSVLSPRPIFPFIYMIASFVHLYFGWNFPHIYLGLVYFQKILQNRNSSTFVCIWQILFNYGLIRLKRFISSIPTKLCN